MKCSQAFWGLLPLWDLHTIRKKNVGKAKQIKPERIELHLITNGMAKLNTLPDEFLHLPGMAFQNEIISK